MVQFFLQILYTYFCCTYQYTSSIVLHILEQLGFFSVFPFIKYSFVKDIHSVFILLSQYPKYQSFLNEFCRTCCTFIERVKMYKLSCVDDEQELSVLEHIQY